MKTLLSVILFMGVCSLICISCDAQSNIVDSNSDDLSIDYYNKATDYIRQSNNKKAMLWAKKSAELGHSEAQFLLGFMYELGKAGEINVEKSVFWYNKASLQGNSNAQFNLAILHSSREEYEKAFKWMKSSAQQENVKAQYNLGVFYFNGKGTKRNVSKAIHWLKMAENGKSLLATEYIKTHSLNDLTFMKDKSDYIKQMLIPNSKIKLVSVVEREGTNFYSTSTGKRVSEQQVYLIRKICELYENKIELAELLLDVQLSEGKSGHIWIQPNTNTEFGLIKLYLLAVIEKSFLRMRVQYSGKAQLFFKSLEIRADDYKWKSSKQKSQSYTWGTNIIEYIDILVKGENVEMFKKMAHAKKIELKLTGVSETIDKELSQEEKSSISKIFEIHEILMN